tara:strand:- start:89 stop:1087 length:999 start_codon:yes stop_codon:yes gene_type:complete
VRVGSIVFATQSGLGILAKDFYDNGIITDVIVVEHGNYQNMNWYEDSHIIKNHTVTKDDRDKIFDFVKSVDCLFLFETNFFPEILEAAKQYNKKVILMPMYESTLFPLQADLYLCPSLLDFDYYNYMYEGRKIKTVTVPVNSNIEWKERTHANKFVHNAGNGSFDDRNGTNVVIEALKYIKSPIELVVRSQKNSYIIEDKRVEVINSNIDYKDLWKDGDVFLFPERFNALSLPIQEAFASGMLVMCGNRYPLNNWLPNLPMLEVSNYEIKQNNNIQYKSAIYNPKNIASCIDNWYGNNIETYSKLGKQWYDNNNWNKLKQDYINKIIEECNL